MTLLVPRDLPDAIAALQEFEIQRIDYTAPEAGGAIGGVQAGFPLWLASWSIGKIGAAKSDEVRAWFARRRGGARPFFGRDLTRPFPKAHIAGFAGMTRAGGGAFDGSATSWSETIDGEDDCRLTLTGLPAGLALGFTDYVGFKWDDPAGADGNNYRRALVRVVVGGTASGGGSVTVTVEPPVPALVPAGAVAHLDNPKCVMKLVTEQSKLDAIDRRLAVRGGTIAGLQDLRS